MPKHIDNKDKADNITKILADRLEETKQKLLNLSFSRLLVGTSQNADIWYKSQIANLGAFKLQTNKMVGSEKKSVLQAVKQGSRELNLNSKQQNKLLKEVNAGMNGLAKLMIANHTKNVASIKVQARVKKNNVVDNLTHRGVAQFGSAPGLGPGGRRFESCHLDHYECSYRI